MWQKEGNGCCRILSAPPDALHAGGGEAGAAAGNTSAASGNAARAEVEPEAEGSPTKRQRLNHASAVPGLGLVAPGVSGLPHMPVIRCVSSVMWFWWGSAQPLRLNSAAPLFASYCASPEACRAFLDRPPPHFAAGSICQGLWYNTKHTQPRIGDLVGRGLQLLEQANP